MAGPPSTILLASPLQAIRLCAQRPLEATQAVEILNQRLLPHRFEHVPIHGPRQAFDAIRSMTIRGAPAIASLAALAIGCGLLRQSFDSLDELGAFLRHNSALLISARPTAVNVREAVQRILARFDSLVCGSPLAGQGASPVAVEGVVGELVKTCKSVWEEDRERNLRMASHGAQWLLDRLQPSGVSKVNLLTVCNTGSLATSGHGTALGIIATLRQLGRLGHVYYMQTAPYMQGARLTSLELRALDIEATMVCDTAAAYVINSGKVDAFVAGADRIASNGDTANKISTFQIALLCHHALPKNKHEIPVVIAAPMTTVDLEIHSGDQIEIEHRPSLEACTVTGMVCHQNSLLPPTDSEQHQDGSQVKTVLITPPDTQALNPAFDVTPSRLISAIVTELGVVEKAPHATSFDLQKFVRDQMS